PETTLRATQKCIWKALLRGRNLKEGSVLHLIPPQTKDANLTARVIEKNSQSYTVEFNWFSDDISFSDILNQVGHIPLPPYISRSDENIDRERYQTIYGNKLGSVASHTAGLHFTSEVLNKLKEKSISFAEVTLHISLGTFKPIQTTNIHNHTMHKENFSVTYCDLTKIYNFLKNRSTENLLVAIGTTSVRTLESIFWYAQFLYHQKPSTKSEPLEIPQYIWKHLPKKLSIVETLEFLLDRMEQLNINSLAGGTSLFITPDYKINFFDALVTNFHQPKSTLLLLVYAFVGEDWKKIYQSALENKYRFLSYGDSSLLFKTNL
ncbi:MAG: S-adenosylmethionine:tRNA ribosyltransferase-isomerase, partial [Candidatus Kapaibacteriota bacterium]